VAWFAIWRWFVTLAPAAWTSTLPSRGRLFCLDDLPRDLRPFERGR